MRYSIVCAIEVPGVSGRISSGTRNPAIEAAFEIDTPTVEPGIPTIRVCDSTTTELTASTEAICGFSAVSVPDTIANEDAAIASARAARPTNFRVDM
jgi:hypothetical protein